MTPSNSPAHRLSRSEFLPIRGLQYHVRQWGRVGAPPIVMLHGWMDVSASFQFVVDCLQHDWHVIAPDLRGFGLTEAPGSDTYWFPDYLGDLDALLAHYVPEGPVNLLGHSMGANVLGLYAGARPERVRRLVNLEGFGMPTTQPQQAPGRYRKWLDELRSPQQLRTYALAQDVAARLQKTNPRLSNQRAAFLASCWARENSAGRWEILGDPAHKQSSPLLFHVEEVLACWEQISAPVLWMEAEQTDIWNWMGPKPTARLEIDRRLSHLRDLKKEMIADAGHMLHHDQPELLAQLIEAFFMQGDGV